MFIDASAMCAILLSEVEHDAFADKIESAARRLTSPIAIYETAMALSRHSGQGADQSGCRVLTFLAMAGITVMQIDEQVGTIALEAHARFGKGRHPARLNLGDCFAYACARTQNVPLLFKGDDFRQTDIAVA